jgi:hypothetical protein
MRLGDVLVAVVTSDGVADLSRWSAAGLVEGGCEGKRRDDWDERLTFWVVDFSCWGWTAEATESALPLTKSVAYSTG